MSKKTYQAVAAIMHGRKVSSGLGPVNSGSPAYTLWVSLRDDLERLFAEDNPRFDHARFIEACETGKCKGMRPRQ
jgi:hypothetical protein